MIESFHSLLLFGAIGAMLLAGVVFRAKIPFFQKFMVPASIIGGLLGLVATSCGIFGLTPKNYTMISFHLFNASFISIGLTGAGNTSQKGSGRKKLVRGALWVGLMHTIMMMGQGLIGGSSIYLFNFLTGTETYPGLGMLVAHAFLQGPGQALAVGGAWEQSFGITDATSVALTFSAIGFLVAFFIGVPLANWGVRKKLAAYPDPQGLSREVITGVKDPESTVSLGRETVHPSNLDTLTVHLALVAAVYALNFGICKGMATLGAGTMLEKVAYGLFFVWGLFVAMGVRKILEKIGLFVFFDPAQQQHVTGLFVDLLMVAVMMSIQIAVVMKYLGPIVFISVACTLYTFAVLFYFANRVSEFNLERMLVNFGAGTGTVPSGITLCRIADPGFKTTAVVEVGFAQLVLVMSSMHIMAIAVTLPGKFTIPMAMGIWAATGVACVALLYLFKLVGKPRLRRGTETDHAAMDVTGQN